MFRRIMVNYTTPKVFHITYGDKGCITPCLFVAKLSN